MRLTYFSDYSLRTLMYLGENRDRLVPIAEVARVYRISYHHLVKVAQLLAEIGVVESVRGRGGGMRLAKDPRRINIGWVVRRTEPDFHIVECFDAKENTCPITRVCRLKGALRSAQRSFIETLDGHTLADFVDEQESSKTAGAAPPPAYLQLTRRSGQARRARSSGQNSST